MLLFNSGLEMGPRALDVFSKGFLHRAAYQLHRFSFLKKRMEGPLEEGSHDSSGGNTGHGTNGVKRHP